MKLPLTTLLNPPDGLVGRNLAASLFKELGKVRKKLKLHRNRANQREWFAKKVGSTAAIRYTFDVFDITNIFEIEAKSPVITPIKNCCIGNEITICLKAIS
ncbi:hypothetical protein [Nostoc sp.]|uniref:hypothetical protein n=1 Tax=Nostoc sp. TaxID=1180 RepID=UPI002FFB9724